MGGVGGRTAEAGDDERMSGDSGNTARLPFSGMTFWIISVPLSMLLDAQGPTFGQKNFWLILVGTCFVAAGFGSFLERHSLPALLRGRRSLRRVVFFVSIAMVAMPCLTLMAAIARFVAA